MSIVLFNEHMDKLTSADLATEVLTEDPHRTKFKSSERVLANEVLKQRRLIDGIRAVVKRPGKPRNVHDAAIITEGRYREIKELLRLYDNGE